jgi:cytochrome c553
MRLLRLPTLLLLASLSAPTVWAQSTSPESTRLHQRALAATCANCHGTDGRTVEGSAVPPLAGMPKVYLQQQMAAFKDGSRTATVMHQIAKGLTDAQVESIAAYFAAQKR